MGTNDTPEKADPIKKIFSPETADSVSAESLSQNSNAPQAEGNVPEFSALAGHEALSAYAHDLNNLLVGILGSAELLDQDKSLPMHWRARVARILECARRASLITEEMHARAKDFYEKIVRLPPLESPASGSEQAQALNSTVRSNQARDTVLVIDDEEAVRSVSAAFLQKQGFRVVVASNGPDGIKLMEENKERIICIFLDLSMPYMRGNLVFARLKAIDNEVQVYLISGYSDRQALADFDTQGIIGFLQKPFKGEEILRAVKDCVESHANRQATAGLSTHCQASNAS